MIFTFKYLLCTFNVVLLYTRRSFSYITYIDHRAFDIFLHYSAESQNLSRLVNFIPYTVSIFLYTRITFCIALLLISTIRDFMKFQNNTQRLYFLADI